MTYFFAKFSSFSRILEIFTTTWKTLWNSHINKHNVFFCQRFTCLVLYNTDLVNKMATSWWFGWSSSLKLIFFWNLQKLCSVLSAWWVITSSSCKNSSENEIISYYTRTVSEFMEVSKRNSFVEYILLENKMHSKHENSRLSSIESFHEK